MGVEFNGCIVRRSKIHHRPRPSPGIRFRHSNVDAIYVKSFFLFFCFLFWKFEHTIFKTPKSYDWTGQPAPTSHWSGHCWMTCPSWMYSRNRCSIDWTGSNNCQSNTKMNTYMHCERFKKRENGPTGWHVLKFRVNWFLLSAQDEGRLQPIVTLVSSSHARPIGWYDLSTWTWQPSSPWNSVYIT